MITKNDDMFFHLSSKTRRGVVFLEVKKANVQRLPISPPLERFTELLLLFVCVDRVSI